MTYRVRCNDCGLDEKIGYYTAHTRAKEHEREYPRHWVTVEQVRE
jgi:hypothetical protein